MDFVLVFFRITLSRVIMPVMSPIPRVIMPIIVSVIMSVWGISPIHSPLSPLCRISLKAFSTLVLS
jgi:hypothetical protein